MVAVTAGEAVLFSVPDAGADAGDCALTPAMPVAVLQEAVSSTTPVTAAHLTPSPARMISTRVTVSEDNLYLCSRRGPFP
jgi:hypothetical protein